MRAAHIRLVPLVILGGLLVGGQPRASAGDLIVDLGRATGVTLVGALHRWDDDGQPTAAVDPRARIDVPRVDAEATRAEGDRWVFRGLPPGRYDLVILTSGHVRVEGFHYPPLAEFDPILPPDAQAPEEARETIVEDIARSRHYENKVTPLFLAGNETQMRVLVQLVRDQPTSFDGDFGAPVATVRHEVWQYTNRHGGWVKDKKTAILDRILLPRSEFRRWTWVWEPRLGGIEVRETPVRVSYPLPDRFDPQTAQGWFPN